MNSDKQKLISEYLIKGSNNYHLNFFGNKVWAPYRINIPFNSDRRRYGKWPPKRLRKDVIEIANERGFDIKNSSASEIRIFMEKELLGIDCSGFAYHILDYMLHNYSKSSMTKLGFPWASSTNVDLLTSEKFSIRTDEIVKNFRPGDMIRFGTSSLNGQHIIVIISTSKHEVKYAHSVYPVGVSFGVIEIDNPDRSIFTQRWLTESSSRTNLRAQYNPNHSDGVFRLCYLI